MNTQVKISKTWYVICLIGLIIACYGGVYKHKVLIFLGLLLLTGSLICGFTGLIIKYLRKLKRDKNRF